MKGTPETQPVLTRPNPDSNPDSGTVPVGGPLTGTRTHPLRGVSGPSGLEATGTTGEAEAPTAPGPSPGYIATNQPPPRREPIDFARIAAQVDLPALLMADGVEVKRGMALCPFHTNIRTPAFSVYEKDGRWRFKCHGAGCEVAGDALEYIRLRDRLDSVVQAAQVLDPSLVPAGQAAPVRRPRPIPPPKPERPEKTPATADAEWQWAVAALIAEGVDALWGPAGRDACAWLKARGLKGATIRRFRLGFSPGWRQSAPLAALDRGKGPEPIWVAPGVSFPWPSPPDDSDFAGPWAGCNVRRLRDDPFEPLPDDMPKYLAFAGGEPGHGFPDVDFLPSQLGVPLLATEGEFDALLAWQAVGDLANVTTLGSASNVARPKGSASRVIDEHAALLIATDHDKAGDKAAEAFRAMAPRKCRRLVLPGGGDIGDFVLNGGNLRSWLKGEFARLGLRPPTFARTIPDPIARYEAIRARMTGESLRADHRDEDVEESEGERLEHRLADDIQGGDPGWWSTVATWSADRQEEFSLLAAHFVREAKAAGREISGVEAERLAAEQMAEVPF